MNGTRDTNRTETAADDGGELDPRQAATLLDQTRRRARRRFEQAPPWLLTIRAILVLAACGTVWLSVRDQHPYQHPTVIAILVIVAFGLLNLGVTLAVGKHATTGISGKTRLRPAEVVIMTALWVAVYLVMIALAFAGVRPAFVYGVYPIAVPLIVVGLAWAAMTALRARWRTCGTALGVAVVGGVAMFAGPVGAWAVAGVGLCLVMLASAAVITWQQRA
jgi:hypothetical protein